MISEIIFDPKKATSKNNELLTKNACHSEYIDDSKLKSLEKALAADDLFLLQGPPGTGKTTFISELVYQILDRKPDSKILIASQSHVAVDHSLTKIKEAMPEVYEEFKKTAEILENHYRDMQDMEFTIQELALKKRCLILL